VATVGAYEAKTKLPELLKRVEQGEHITITKHGTPVAVLVPAGEYPRKDPVAAVAALKEFARGRRLDGLSIQELVDQGRRS
jgi:prevent-host-death family protein